MNCLILVEHNNKQLNPSIKNLLGAAKELGVNPTLLVAGFQCESVANACAKLEGVKSVWLADEACYEHQLAENISALVASFASSFNIILGPASTFGKNCLPRIAALLDITQLSDVNAILEDTHFERPIYAGNAIETVRVLEDKFVLSVRSTAFDPIENEQPPCPVERLHKIFDDNRIKFISKESSTSTRPELAHAKVIVSGGRGLQNAENFRLIEQLADALGAAVGASRAAVDAGYVSNDYQVGQTGKIVAPSLYFAIGISGAVQHLAGMKESKVIVAINKDPDAPIFEVADYGLVGDLFILVPELIAGLKSFQKESLC